mmetsp:Transcript_4811/g.11466  ORF Transcript_4811/g.11466 Transcript_4811/m.11466 type:complete len:200 (-) Transcript_4811:610-1209(-)
MKSNTSSTSARSICPKTCVCAGETSCPHGTEFGRCAEIPMRKIKARHPVTTSSPTIPPMASPLCPAGSGQRGGKWRRMVSSRSLNATLSSRRRLALLRLWKLRCWELEGVTSSRKDIMKTWPCNCRRSMTSPSTLPSTWCETMAPVQGKCWIAWTWRPSKVPDLASTSITVDCTKVQLPLLAIHTWKQKCGTLLPKSMQ